MQGNESCCRKVEHWISSRSERMQTFLVNRRGNNLANQDYANNSMQALHTAEDIIHIQPACIYEKSCRWHLSSITSPFIYLQTGMKDRTDITGFYFIFLLVPLNYPPEKGLWRQHQRLRHFWKQAKQLTSCHFVSNDDDTRHERRTQGLFFYSCINKLAAVLLTKWISNDRCRGKMEVTTV